MWRIKSPGLFLLMEPWLCKWMHHDLSKRRWPSTNGYGGRSQKTEIYNMGREALISHIIQVLAWTAVTAGRQVDNKIYRTSSFYVYEFSENIGVIFVFVCLLFDKFSAPSYTRVRELTIPWRADRNKRVQQRSPRSSLASLHNRRNFRRTDPIEVPNYADERAKYFTGFIFKTHSQSYNFSSVNIFRFLRNTDLTLWNIFINLSSIF
jgi:hypothetical protein